MARESVEPPQTGKANDERCQSLSASRSCRPKERSLNGRRRVLPSCPSRLRCVSEMQRIYRAAGRSAPGRSLERLEPCEGKLSRTVLRGRERATARAYPVRTARLDAMNTRYVAALVFALLIA